VVFSVELDSVNFLWIVGSSLCIKPFGAVFPGSFP
jgi:hypothetical protein